MSKRWDDNLDLDKNCFERALVPTYFTNFPASTIHMGGASDIREYYLFSRWQVSYHTVIYTASGKGTLETPEKEEEIYSNSLTILPAGSSFRLHYAGEPWDFAWIILLDIPEWHHLKQREECLSYCQSSQVIYHLLCLAYYHVEDRQRKPVLASLHEHVYSTLDFLDHASEYENRLHQLFQEVEEQLHYPWTIEEMTQRIHYSAPHFHRLCAKFFGCSPMQKLTTMRMERACYLLRYTEWPVSEVASRVGYNDPFNFSTRFKKLKKVSPRTYRQQQIS